MAVRNTSNIEWYKSWWFGGVVVVGIVFLIFFAATKTPQFLNYREYLKTEIDSLQNEVKLLNKSIERLEQKRDSVRIIRQKITIQPELDLLKKLAREYEAIKAREVVVTDSISMRDLHKFYLQKFNQEKEEE